MKLAGLARHMNPIQAGSRTYNACAATGNCGQGGLWSRWGNQFIGGLLIPAMRKGEVR